jgi:hypothetical protein
MIPCTLAARSNGFHYLRRSDLRQSIKDGVEAVEFVHGVTLPYSFICLVNLAGL